MKKIKFIFGFFLMFMLVALSSCQNVHIHKYETAKYDEQYHWTECSCGEIDNKQEHSYKTEEQKPTYTEKGWVKYTCSCGYSYTEEVPVLKEPFKVEMHIDTFVIGSYVEYTNFTFQILEGDVYREVTDFTFDLEGVVLTEENNKVVVSYGEYHKEFAIHVVDPATYIKNIEVITEPGLVVTKDTVISEKVLARYVYLNDTYSDYFTLNEDQVSFVQNKGLIEITVNVENNEINYSQMVTVENPVVSTSLVLPTKVVYDIDEEFALNGLGIRETYVYGIDNIVLVDSSMVDSTNFNKSEKGDYEIIVSYQGKELKFVTYVRSTASSIELVGSIQEGTLFTSKSTLESVAAAFAAGALKIVYNDESVEYMDVSAAMLSIDNFSMGDHTVTLTFMGLFLEFNITVEPDGISVSELLAKENGYKGVVSGVVIGTNIYFIPKDADEELYYEYILKDLESSCWINICGLTEKLTKGDIVEVNGEINTYGSGADPNRRVIKNVTGITVVDHLNNEATYELDLSTAITISDDATFKEIFSNDNRPNTYNQIYKLHGNLAGITYKKNTYRIFFPGVTTYGFKEGGQYFNNTLSGVFRRQMIAENLSTTATALLGSTTSYTTAPKTEKDIYVIYCGSDGAYYGNFVIVGDYCITEMEPIFKNYTLEGEVKTEYTFGEPLEIENLEIAKNYVYGFDSELITITSEMIVLPDDFDINKEGKYEVQVVLEGEVIYTIEVNYIAVKYVSMQAEVEDNLFFETSDDIIETIDLSKVTLTLTTESGIMVTEHPTKEVLTLGTYVSDNETGKIKQTIVVDYLELSATFEVYVNAKAISVTEALTQENGTLAYVSGIVVGYNYYGNNSSSLENYETVIKDPTNNKIICVRGFETKIDQNTLVLFKATIGLITSATADASRVYCEAVSSTIIETITDSSKIQLDLSQAIEINDMATFKELFSDENRPNNIYGLFKLSAKIKGNRSYDNIYRLYFEGINATGTAENGQYFNSKLSAVMKGNCFNENTTYKIADIFGDTKGWDTKEAGVELYVVYLGSSGAYYGDFVCLGDYCVGGISK